MILNYPTFFKTRPKIIFHDPLQKFLGTTQGGIVEFTYLDVVKNAGHSCPTVSGAYLMTLKGLKALYGKDFPIRGEIDVAFNKSADEGVTGVMANVISQLTGATEKTGFKGIGGKFVRHGLMHFNEEFEGIVKFTRRDTHQSVVLSYDPSSIPAEPKQQKLMQKILKGEANEIEEIDFEVLWQQRVEKIFNHVNEVIEVKEG